MIIATTAKIFKSRGLFFTSAIATAIMQILLNRICGPELEKNGSSASRVNDCSSVPAMFFNPFAINIMAQTLSKARFMI
ncbi:hypothetical protein [Fibrobacter sp. UBA2449]|uniref:hypothetical protein n=1 Tax=Fibrobacter sp. UBA2449 TaxID=1946529 RepID=UPI0025C32AED|nr:hypothetical protein [Fibrobacter sp. UBA2449]